MSAYQELLAGAEADPAVVGLVLTGSAARGTATERSDVDIMVVVPEKSGRWTRTTRTPDLDTIVVSPAELADVSDRWQRYAFRGAQVLLDRLGGRIADLVAAQATPTAAEAEDWARDELDGYVNFVYRAAKSRRDGRSDLARLDEIEAVPWFLGTLFSLHGRIRPYNKYLRWELETYPLPPPWTADLMIPALVEHPVALFPELENVVRDKGLGDVLDAWGSDLDVVRADYDERRMDRVRRWRRP